MVEPGAVLDDRYRIGGLIGTGGMSRVYVAEDLALGRRVAVKVIHPIEDDPSSAERVRTETIALASLTHPSLVVLHDARLVGPGPRYLVMEYVDGAPLSSRLAEGPLSVDEVHRIASELAEALAVVHAGGIVHRDIKPSNILLASSIPAGRPPRAKLGDFGIAHLIGSERITQPGTVIGTAAYLAPEVALGHAPAPPSDVYALGLVLLEALTGGRAFPSAEGPAQVLARLSHDPEVPTALPPLWRELLTAMVQRDPSRRPTALAIVETLSVPHRDAPDRTTAMMAPLPVLPAESAATAAERYARPAAPRSAWRRGPVIVTAAAAVAVVIGAIVAGAFLLRSPAATPVPASTVSTPLPSASETAVTPSPSTSVPVATQEPAPGPVDPGAPKGPGGGPGGGKEDRPGKGKGND